MGHRDLALVPSGVEGPRFLFLRWQATRTRPLDFVLIASGLRSGRAVKACLMPATGESYSSAFTGFRNSGKAIQITPIATSPAAAIHLTAS